MRLRSRWSILAAAVAITLLSAGVATLASVGDGKAWVQKNLPSLYPQLRQAAYDMDGEPEGVAESIGVPLMQLHLSRPDVAHFSNLYQHYEDPRFGVNYYAEHNRWRKAELTYEGRTYRVRVKAHGRSPNSHRAGRFISYSIKLRGGEQILGARRFNLIIRERIQPERHIGLDVAERLGVVAHRLKPIRLQINAWEEKLYYLEHRLNEAGMEAIGRPSWRIFGSRDVPSRSLLYTSTSLPLETLQAELLKTLESEEVPEAHRQPIVDRYTDFSRALAEGRCEEMTRFVDDDYMAAFLAARLISGFLGHGNRRGNLYVFFDMASGLFYPVITRDHVPRALRDTPGDTLESVVNMWGSIGNPFVSTFFTNLSCNESLRQAAYRQITDFTGEHRATIGAAHKALVERYERLSYLGWARITARKMGKPLYEFTGDNLDLLSDYLAASTPEVWSDTAAGTLKLQVTPRSMAALHITRLTVPTASGELDLTEAVAHHRFATGLGLQSERVQRTYALNVDLGGAVATGPPDLNLSNTLTEQVVSWTAAEVREPTHPMGPPKDPFVAWRAEHPDLKIHRTDAGHIVFQPGVHTLEQDVVLPPGAKLVLAAGAQIRLGPNRVLAGWAGIDINGTAEAPVTLSAVDPARPYGTVAVLGTPDIDNRVHHLRQSGGSERWVDGVYFSGGLSIHARGGRVDIAHSTIAKNRADDGLNVKNASWVTLAHTTFDDNFADHVDLDDCDGVVMGSTFTVQPGGDANGDGLDVSLSKVLVADNRFEGLPDKGVSVGERSEVFLWRNTLSRNGIAAAVKDRSNVWFDHNRFTKNTKDIAVYRKKAIFGGGHLHLADGVAPGLVTEIDELSTSHSFDPQPTRALLGDNRALGDVDLGPLFDTLRKAATP